MPIASAGMVCENGCGRLLDLSTSERRRLCCTFPELVVECVCVSKMKL